ncbi:hypothetical protein [Indibacter alkaliphilus]|uniref:hypothetical protein n=1 Tax=Indibacter alkaliphilus TaxID=579922 RepID=UPI0002823F8A|nr:hypothetical protein [Indibacter alkaliphilus]
MKYSFHRALAGGESLKSDSTDFSRKNKLNVLRFEESDIERLEALVGDQFVMDRSLREGFNLDRNRFGEASMKLRVRIRKKLDSEAIACSTLGIRLPAVFVIHAERID